MAGAAKPRRLNLAERNNLEDGIRRAVARLTYESEWEWFLKRHSCDVLTRAVEHSPCQNEICNATGVTSSSLSACRKGVTKLKPRNYLKIIAHVYPEYAKLIEAELRDIERLHD